MTLNRHEIKLFFFYLSANQETLAALVQFFSTSFSSGESAASFTDLPTVPEEPAMDSYQPQADVSLAIMTSD